MNKRKDPSEFLRRLQETAVNTDLEICPLATTVLLKYTEGTLKSQIKQYIYEELRKVPNIKTLDAVLPAIEVVVSDDNTQRIAKGGRKIFCNKEKNVGLKKEMLVM